MEEGLVSTPSPFAQPSSASVGDKFEPTQLSGHLLLVYPGATRMVMTQQYGEKEAVAADIHVLDVIDPATGQPPVLKDTLIFNAVLIGQLTSKEAREVGMVLGRLGQGANTKGNAPWLMMDYAPQDEQVARQYIATHPREQFAQPQGQQTPAPTQWGQAPAAPQPDLWAGVQAAPAGPPQGQWGAAPQSPATPGVQAAAAPAPAAGSPAPQWGNPAASAQAAPAPTAPASPSAVDAATLAAFLTSKNVPVQSMTEDQVRMIASTYPDCPQAQQQAPPF